MTADSQVKKDPIVFQTKLRFFLAFLFLALLTLGTFLILLNQVEQAENDAKVLGVMENQYGFVHKASFLAVNYAQSNDMQERRALRDEVHATLGLIIAFTPKNSEGALASEGVPPPVSKMIRRLYLAAPNKLNEEVLDFIASTKNFLMSTPVHMSSESPRLRTLQTKTLRLMSVLRAAVKHYQKESRAQIQFLKMLGIYLFVLTLLCLCAVGLFVFLPAVQRISSYLSTTQNINLELEQKVKERTFELEQKAAELAVSNEQLQAQILERARIEEELRKANIFLDSVIENIPDMIFIKDANELKFIRFNRAGEELLGFSRKELLGQNDHSFFPKEQADFFIQKDRETLDRRVMLEIPEEPIRTRHKGARILNTKKIPIMGPNGNPMFLLGISEDITERIRSEKQLRELSMAMENALDGIARLDSHMNFLSLNKAYANMLGYSPQEMTGMNRLTTVCPEDHDKIEASFEEMKKNGKAELEIKAIRKDGTIFHQYVVIVRPTESGQSFDGFYCFAKDVTERKYREAIDIKSELIQMVSHELRTPIHSVKEGISIVLEGLTGQLSSEQREVLEIAKRCADRLTRLVTDVLAFHKFEAGVIEFHFRKSDLNELVREAAKSMQPLAKEKGLKFELSLQSDLPPVEADHDKIVQVLTNLLQNAIKFTGEGVIAISSSTAGSQVKVSVKDTGIGIQQKDMSKIFRKFGQLEAAKSIAPGGTGLGLAISKKIIEGHHGKLEVESEYRRGSVFSFTLPLTQPA